jgi:hypothetical protein
MQTLRASPKGIRILGDAAYLVVGVRGAASDGEPEIIPIQTNEVQLIRGVKTMQTFLPYKSFTESAACLDRQRLGKQRVEAKQILSALLGITKGWRNHPCTIMWEGYEFQLASYGLIICDEWIERGYTDNVCRVFFLEHRGPRKRLPRPHWLTDEFCRRHRSNLIRKMPDHYGPMWVDDIPMDLPYLWGAE